MHTSGEVLPGQGSALWLASQNPYSSYYPTYDLTKILYPFEHLNHKSRPCFGADVND